MLKDGPRSPSSISRDLGGAAGHQMDAFAKVVRAGGAERVNEQFVRRILSFSPCKARSSKGRS